MSLWEWIRSNGWPLRMIENIAIKYYYENQMKSITHLELSILANEVNRTDFILIENYFLFRFVNKF
jgi:hypothetical protein